MQAIRYCGYGSPEVLGLTLLEKPVPTDEQVLIKVRAASVNPLDWHYMRGTPYLMRLGVGLRKPKVTRLGVDFSGTVEAVGAKVTKFKPGDEVFGGRFGAFAEYIVARQDGAVTLKPANITFEQAASVPIAAVTALQSLRDRGRLQPGQKVLINGASGGVGTFAVQIAKSYGAEVTGVCSGRNVEMVKSLGADHVVDYTQQDFAKTDERYDLILDNVPNHTLAEYRHIMKEKGIYLQIGGGGPHDGNWIGPFGRVINAWVVSHFISQDMAMFLADMNQDDLAVLAELMAAGKVTPVIDRTYTLRETSAAIAYLEEGHARGKVVITMQ
ncbi:MAG TPA: NAD(P)-dependent alcohol dehydrogenase [Candidatus Polarisedimenticolia bacterium]|nr:NAD(P)-dependent alcohol dehydrogenase [Candidatus Polarisedimenticolia bacterium]